MNNWRTVFFAIYIIDAKIKISNVKTLFCDHIDLQSSEASARDFMRFQYFILCVFFVFFSRQKIMFKRLIYC